MLIFLILGIVAECFLKVQCYQSEYSKPTSDSGVVEWLKPGSKVTFDAPEAPHTGLLNRLHWVEKNERSTSRNYTLWEKADVYLLEWPGNITVFNSEKPVVKWGRDRAKYVEDYCAEEFTGIEMRAYAYKYVYLTWGPYRLTRTYSPPLTVPRSILPFNTIGKLSQENTYEENELNVITVFDIAFSFDSFLLAFSDGVIKISGLEMGWAELSRTPKRPLKYALSKGVDHGVNKFVTQSCCTKTEFCSFGDVVFAYREQSHPHLIYMSKNGGESFTRLEPMSSASGYLKVVLSYPEHDQLVIFHGNSSKVELSRLILLKNGSSHYQNTKNKPTLTLKTNGSLQGSRLGAEASFVVWDDCNVWYSSNIGLNVSKSLFYVHKKIIKPGKKTAKHHIIPEYCMFRKHSILAYGKTGQFGLLDSNNVFYLGIDTKTDLSQLVALQMDMSAMIRNTKLSVTPYFDMLNLPKLLYPPKFLRIPKKFQGEKYEKRLGMRLLPKNVYPSDFILSFYEERVELPEAQQFLALSPCQTSSLQVNNSISQKRKFYSLPLSGFIWFSITFKSRLNNLKQLYFEPRRILKYLDIKIKPNTIDMVEQENPRYWIKYNVTVRPRTASALNKLFRVMFYTKNALRCNQQPRVPIYIKVQDKATANSHLPSDDDMKETVYLKSVTGDGEAEYLDTSKMGETIKVDTCPLTKGLKTGK